MALVGIVTDSVASIPEALVQSLKINWVPYYIHWGKEVMRDLVSARRETFYAWLPTVKELPTTASPGPGDYLAMYQQLCEEQGVDQIASIHMASKASGAYQAARAAQEMAGELLPGLAIEVIDTLNASMCHGWMVIEAARAALAGKPLGEIVVTVKALIPVTRMIMTADTLRYLYLGGRIGKAKHLAGSLLNIRPLIGMENGVIVPLGTARSRARAYQMMVERVETAVGDSKVKVAYMHAAAQEEAEKIKALVEQRVHVVESLVAELSPALGVHTGPGTAGLCYFPLNGQD
jgi:DegV family protein with EDD domain